MIINETELLEDTVKRLGELLEISNKEAKALLTRDHLEWILECMFEAQSECLDYIKDTK